MKISLALGPRRTLSPQTAWGCLTTNLALPGSGSLLAGRRCGYGQIVLALSGTALTLLLGARAFAWYLAHWSHFQDAQADPVELLVEMWRVVRWPLFGFGLFGLGWLWALATSLSLLASAKESDSPEAPPRLNQLPGDEGH